VNPSETAFLALGLVLGAAIGAAIVEAVRARPAPRREVRVTVVPNSVSPRRSATLADAGSPQGREPIPGSPDDTAWPEPVEVPGPPAAFEPLVVAAAAPVDEPVDDVAGAGPADVPADEAAQAALPAIEPDGEAAEVTPEVAAEVTPEAAPEAIAPEAIAPEVAPDVAPVAIEPIGETADAGVAGADVAEPAVVRLRGPADAVSVPETAIAVPIAAGPERGTEHASADPELAPVAVGGAIAAAALAVRARPPVESARPGIPATVVAVAIESERNAEDTAHAQVPESADTGGAAHEPEVLEPPVSLESPAAEPLEPREPSEPLEPLEPPAPPPVGERPLAIGADPCAGARTLVDERCALAAVAREQAKVAADALREEQRAYDMLRDRVERAQALADPREIAAAKDALHRAFRQASAAAASAEDTEAAARDWLNQVNDLNARAREAARQVEAGGTELRAALPRLERLSVEADATRIGAESAELACHEARERLARCEESLAETAAAAAVQAHAEGQPVPVESGWPTGPGMQPGLPEPGPEPGQAAGLPRIIRVLRGDVGARDRVVTAMAGGDPEAARAWHIRLARLLDAISARAIEDGYLDLPDDHPFWGLFTHLERREIVGALSALGYRYDGMGAFTDGRVPAQRDLSLAVGYAGLDRMRIRVWPRESELASLYDQATVAADEWLAHEADDFSMGEMVDALGARAADLTDAWNAWGRLRPALLAED
jgi:hypothetical protein